MLRAYDVLYNILLNAGQAEKLNIMDNAASTVLKHLLQKRRKVVQLEPSHSHRRNATERGIHTFKNNFVAVLVSGGNSFLIYLWCQMAEQAEITINLLRT